MMLKFSLLQSTSTIASFVDDVHTLRTLTILAFESHERSVRCEQQDDEFESDGVG